MALPILDGNQSATTLSTILSGGEHTPAHTVVSLGSTAISNITSAVSGSVVSISNFPASQTIAGTVTIGNSVTISTLLVSPSYQEINAGISSYVGDYETFPISGTVTVGAMPNGSLTTRFGSVTTANTAQITSAVTNSSRKYLLAQNISTGTVTIGIGFSPTTTQGIQLAAGAGLTFDSFVPTGAVYWLGATTGAAYTILEG